MASIRKKSHSGPGSENAAPILELLNKKSKSQSNEIGAHKASSKKPRYVLLTKRSIEINPAENKPTPNEKTSMKTNKEVTSMTTTKEVTSRVTTKDVTSTKTIKTVGDVASKKDGGCCKIRTVCITAIIVVVLLVAFCAIAIVVWLTLMSEVPTTTVLEPTTNVLEPTTTVPLEPTTTVPEPTSTMTTLGPTTAHKYGDVPVVNLTEYCLRNLTSKCHFYAQKYLTNCSQLMTCISIGYTVGFRFGYKSHMKADFTPFDAESILVPNHAPCMLGNAPGRCIEGECELADLKMDILLGNYSRLDPQNGSLDKAGSPESKMPYDQENCITVLPRARKLFSPLVSGKCERLSDSCMMFKAFLHRCWAPLPSAGGAPCSDQVVAIDYHQPCPSDKCREFTFTRSTLSNFDCVKMKFHVFYPLLIPHLANETCGGSQERFRGIFRDDFFGCCYRDRTEVGYCMAGHCLIPKKGE